MSGTEYKEKRYEVFTNIYRVTLYIPAIVGTRNGCYIELMILQAARVRMSRTEYIACPSCGRTLYDIEGTLAAIRARTSHLKNLKIGVTGCIVNGPGEMADADYGYVGAAPGRITLYKGRTVVEKNIPQEEALDRLVALIKANGDWADPENQPERP